MKDTHAEVHNSNSLQQQLCSTVLEHIVNRRKHTKDKYVSMLGYDIAMYTQRHEELESGTGSSEQCAHNLTSHSEDVRCSQDDD